MILYCGVVREEITLPGVCVDMLLYEGTTDIQGDIYEVDTWKLIKKKYPEKFSSIFIDGGIHNRFSSLNEKNEIMEIMRSLCTDNIIIYGKHLFQRYCVDGVTLCEDILKREQNLPFTNIPVAQYTMKNFQRIMSIVGNKNHFKSLRCNMEYKLKF